MVLQFCSRCSTAGGSLVQITAEVGVPDDAEDGSIEVSGQAIFKPLDGPVRILTYREETVCPSCVTQEELAGLPAEAADNIRAMAEE